MKRFAVTGMGVVSAVGIGREAFWHGLVGARCGIAKVRRFDTGPFERHLGGEVHGFDVDHHFPGDDEVKGLGRAKQMMLAASAECLRQAALGEFDPFRVGVAVGTTIGESWSLEAITNAVCVHGEKAIPADAVLDYPPQTIPQAVARRFGLYGPNLMVSNACAAGNFSVGEALRCISTGEADAVLAGGADAFSRYAFSGFCRLGAVSPDVPRPFSRGRKGMIPGEGAAALLIEDLERAERRGARVLAEIVGYGESCDAHHITQPHYEGIARCVRAALADAALPHERISAVSVHGTGTLTNDATETRALQLVFGERLRDLPITAVKSMIGHPMGAASAIECVAAILSLEHQFVTPTAHFIGEDPECAVDCVPNTGRPAYLEYVLKTSSAFGGNNSCLVLKRAEARS
jgi:3-oxoacyl-[acyl-carrier-protein] synthase II